VLASQGKYKETEAMHRRVLERREKVLGKLGSGMVKAIEFNI
jgi:hypothetical protein